MKEGIILVWLVFLLTAYIALFITVPLKKFKHLWPAGILGTILIYIIDSTFTDLGAFSYTSEFSLPFGIPVLYWMSSFAGGIIFINYYPDKKTRQISYVLLVSFLFLIIELIIHRLGYMHYHNWNPVRSFFLNIVGFSATVQISKCFVSN